MHEYVGPVVQREEPPLPTQHCQRRLIHQHVAAGDEYLEDHTGVKCVEQAGAAERKFNWQDLCEGD